MPLRSGAASAVEICAASLAAIDAQDGGLHAFITVDREHALARAAAVDAGHDRGPLAGVPIAIKDNICTRGLPTTASSKILAGYAPPYDATVVDRLLRAGAVIVGKTNCDEFAMGSSTENSALGPSRNPWDRERTPGGSSGGSAVAVAAGFVPAALGSDTGGSIRQPAAFCGLVGLKPTYGRVSRYGLLAFASSLDQIGPLTHTVRDAAILTRVIAGADPADATASAEPVPDFAAALTGDVRGLRIGVPGRTARGRCRARGLAPVRARRSSALQRMGATIESMRASARRMRRSRSTTSWRRRRPARTWRGTTASATATARPAPTRCARCTTARATRASAPEVKRRIMLGTYVLSAGYYDAYYRKAQQVRTLDPRRLRRRFRARRRRSRCRPRPTPPFRLGEKVDDPLQMYLADVFTVSANLTGLPALSVPCGFTPDGLPVGLQLTGRMFEESVLLRLGDAYERQADWWQRRPPAA